MSQATMNKPQGTQGQPGKGQPPRPPEPPKEQAPTPPTASPPPAKPAEARGARAPYVGADVYWWPRDPDSRLPVGTAACQPWSARITRVNEDGTVTLAAFNPTGGSLQARLRVPFSERPQASRWTWMDAKPAPTVVGSTAVADAPAA
jgi:hypothetical protein